MQVYRSKGCKRGECLCLDPPKTEDVNAMNHNRDPPIKPIPDSYVFAVQNVFIMYIAYLLYQLMPLKPPLFFISSSIDSSDTECRPEKCWNGTVRAGAKETCPSIWETYKPASPI